MQRLTGLLQLTFWVTIASVLPGRAFYFYTRNVFAFDQVANLWIAVGYGLVYVCGAMLSHRLALRFKERRVLQAMMIGLAVASAAMGLCIRWPFATITAFILSSFFIGGTWPVVESFISAGRSPAETRRAVGRFNLTWSASFPFPIAAAGQLLNAWPEGLFFIPAAIALAMLPIIHPLPMHPTHLPADDPDRPAPDELARLQRQLRSARWLMLLSYALIFVLVPIFPEILQNRLGLDVRVATPLASSVDVARFVAFLLLHLWGGWHGRRRWLVAAATLMPVGFFMTLLDANVPTVLIGAFLFGLTHGVAYYASLNYAMVVENASVEAGGHHEGLIGLSFALGPGMALVGHATNNISFGLIPLITFCILGGMLALRPTGRQRDLAPTDADL